MQGLLEIFKSNQNMPGAPKWTDQQFLDECREQHLLTKLDDQGQPVAFILYRKTPEALEISYLATLPKAKHKGFMTALLDDLAQKAKAENLPVWLEVHEMNQPAIDLYEKFGFKRVGIRPRYYADKGSALLYNYA